MSAAIVKSEYTCKAIDDVIAGLEVVRKENGDLRAEAKRYALANQRLRRAVNRITPQHLESLLAAAGFLGFTDNDLYRDLWDIRAILYELQEALT